MNDAEKRRLKKIGKQVVEQQSRELHERLAEANPAPIGSDAWARNYKAQTLRERELRRSPPDKIAALEVAQEFLLHPADPGPNFLGVPTWYIECPRCHDLLHTVPTQSVACSCGGMRLELATRKIEVDNEIQPRFVRLIARGGKPRRPWWKFW